MATTGPILPVIKTGIDYHVEREKIDDFLRKFKGIVPSNKEQRMGMLDADDSDDEDAEDLEDEMDGMDIGSSSGGGGASGRKGGNGLKYMEQLQRIANREQNSLVIDLNDIAKVSRAPQGNEPIKDRY